MFGIFIINYRIYCVKECALNMVLPSRLFLHLTDLTPMQRFYIIVGVLAGVVFLQFLVIGMRLSSKRSNSTITQYSPGILPPEPEEENLKYCNESYIHYKGDGKRPPPIKDDNA